MYRVSFCNRLGIELFTWEGPIPREGDLVYQPQRKYKVGNVAYFTREDQPPFIKVYVEER